jgi:hypothetical protein
VSRYRTITQRSYRGWLLRMRTSPLAARVARSRKDFGGHEQITNMEKSGNTVKLKVLLRRLNGDKQEGRLRRDG